MSRWMPVLGYESEYKVSEFGEIESLDRADSLGRNRKGKPLKPALKKDGYLIVVLCKNNNRWTRNLHRVVIESFLGKSELTVDHIDGNKLNNSIKNLAYVTHSENCFRRSKKTNEFVGVRKKGDKWYARIMKNKKEIHLGVFKTKKEACLAYSEARGSDEEVL